MTYKCNTCKGTFEEDSNPHVCPPTFTYVKDKPPTDRKKRDNARDANISYDFAAFEKKAGNSKAETMRPETSVKAEGNGVQKL